MGSRRHRAERSIQRCLHLPGSLIAVSHPLPNALQNELVQLQRHLAAVLISDGKANLVAQLSSPSRSPGRTCLASHRRAPNTGMAQHGRLSTRLPLQRHRIPIPPIARRSPTSARIGVIPEEAPLQGLKETQLSSQLADNSASEDLASPSQIGGQDFSIPQSMVQGTRIVTPDFEEPHRDARTEGCCGRAATGPVPIWLEMLIGRATQLTQRTGSAPAPGPRLSE
jgi:hypothetical protein